METLVKIESNQIFLGEDVETITSSINNPITVYNQRVKDVFRWACKHKNELKNLLAEHGAILLRGFKIGSSENFSELFSIISGDTKESKNKSWEKKQICNNSIQNSKIIHMHTENSYANVYDRIFSFYSFIPTKRETPIVDERKLMTFLKTETIEKFREKGILYVRNCMPGIGLDWKTIYQTHDKSKVAKMLGDLGYECTWVYDDHLRIKWRLPAIQNHPVRNEEMWFNHMFYGLKHHYDPAIVEFLGEENLPFVTYYGDGTEIEPEVIQEFVEFYTKNAISLKWQKDDFLLLDNMMFSHGGRPFDRNQIKFTVMGQPNEVKTV